MQFIKCNASEIVVVLCLFCIYESCQDFVDEIRHQQIPVEDLPSNEPDLARERESVFDALRLERHSSSSDEEVLDKLVHIYEYAIKPLEEAFHYNDLQVKTAMNAGQIRAKPMILFLGPWSSGKTTMINYMLDTDVLRVSAEPTTSEFTILNYESKVKNTDGVVLISDKMKEFYPLESYGQNFMERFTGVGLPHPLLKEVTLVDTPGIIENRKQQERGYPFNSVIQWFIDRSELVFVVFDPTKLDVGLELETLFKQLKGKESQIRLILNKADSIAPQELMRVYGALFWSLAPLINVTEPPRVYVGSFWPHKYKQNTNIPLFKEEESSLLNDLGDVIKNKVENKIALVRQHATRVRIHALLVDQYLSIFQNEWTFLRDQDQVIAEVVGNPNKYNVFKTVQSKNNVSPFDMPDPDHYKSFFSIHPLPLFKSLQQLCGYFTECPMNRLETAISKTLPSLLTSANQDKQPNSSKNEL